MYRDHCCNLFCFSCSISLFLKQTLLLQTSITNNRLDSAREVPIYYYASSQKKRFNRLKDFFSEIPVTSNALLFQRSSLQLHIPRHIVHCMMKKYNKQQAQHRSQYITKQYYVVRIKSEKRFYTLKEAFFEIPVAANALLFQPSPLQLHVPRPCSSS